jgi:hypothetical protein
MFLIHNGMCPVRAVDRPKYTRLAPSSPQGEALMSRFEGAVAFAMRRSRVRSPSPPPSFLGVCALWQFLAVSEACYPFGRFA